ncbi:hypothetical protein A4X09_0g6087 [Tilletia walkeri]|uniref:Replication protein A subunit n=1 Tax=Tilletia walkeri TaxID=117179 RepID=A0A8X7N4B2_9BASI|nr:hypothetical protein A4X09_0g6087 [Tilletia walkeri]
MSDIPELSGGALADIWKYDDPTQHIINPILQVISIKKMPATKEGAMDRWRCIISDGKHYTQSMLGSQLRDIAESKEIDRFSVIRLTQYTANAIQDRRIIIILECEVIQADVPDRIGNPISMDDAIKSGAVGSGSGGGGGGGGNASTGARGGGGSSSAAPARRAGGGSSAGPNTGAPVYPIEGLSPYQNKWTIKARVTSKSDIKHYSNQRGEGKLFSVNFLDESGEIKATGFNDAVDRFYPLLQEGKVYFVSRAKVGIAKKQFSNLNNEYEIMFENNTDIQECEDTEDVPEVKYAFVPLDQLETIEPNQNCDVIGIVESVGELGHIIAKASQREVNKREVTLVDQSGMSIRLTLWGKQAQSFNENGDMEDKPVLAAKGVKVGDFGGRSLSLQSSSSMTINPDIPEAHGLRGWYDNQGAGQSFRAYTSASVGGGMGGGAGGAGANLAERRTIAQAKDEGLGMKGEKPDYFNTRATVVYIRQENLYYPACGSDACNKKVTMEPDGTWRCEKCDRTFPEPQYRYILSANVADYTGQFWLSGFNDIGEQLIGVTASELQRLKDENESEFAAILQRAANKMYMFNCRAKQDTFNDQTRVRYTVTKAATMDWAKAGAELAEAIRAYG